VACGVHFIGFRCGYGVELTRQFSDEVTMLESRRTVQGAATLAAAGIVSAVLGWLTLVVVARFRGPEEYAEFSVVWSLYFAVAGILIGLQQETTRAQLAHKEQDGITRLADAASRTILGVLCVAGAGLIFASGLPGVTVVGIWRTAGPTLLALPVLAAAMVVTGALAADARWRAVASLAMADQAVRLVAISAVVLAFPGPLAYGFALAAGLLCYVPLIVHGLLHSPRLACSAAVFGRRSAAAMLSAGCANALVVGLPFLVTVTGESQERDRGVLFAAILMTRTPILLIANAIRPVLLRTFVSHKEEALTWTWKRVPIFISASLVAVLLAWAAGPVTLQLIFGEDFQTSRAMMSALMAGAILILVQTWSGLILVALDRDLSATFGWAVSLAVAISCLALPGSLQERTVSALLLGPVLGIALHLMAVGRHTRAHADRA
jgi:O-antigen/teichoic acid export membrane protein